MNTTILTANTPVASLSILVRPLIVLSCLAIGHTLNAATADAAKPYSLYMGADFDLQKGKEFYRVQNVSGGSFIIDVNRELVGVAMDRGHVNMKIRQELKLGDATITINELEKERAYTPQNDPYQKFLREQQGLAAQQMADTDSRNVRKASNSLAGILANPDGHRPASAETDARAALATAQRTQAADTAAARSDLYNVGFHAGNLNEELAAELFDAIKVSFVVSSPKLLRNPYVVIVAEYREPDDKPGVIHNWIYATELDPIEAQPHRVKIMRGGLPPGFILQKFQLHIYNRGQEVATTASDNQVQMDRQEAFDFLLINYLGSNKGANLPAKAVMGRLSQETRAHFSAAQLSQPYYIKVTKDGYPGEAYLDEGCTQKISDTDLVSTIGNLRFTPALEKGKAVDATARLRFSDLATAIE